METEDNNKQASYDTGEITMDTPPASPIKLKEDIPPASSITGDTGNCEPLGNVLDDKTRAKDQENTELQLTTTNDEPMETETTSQQTDTHTISQETDTHTTSSQETTTTSSEQIDTGSETNSQQTDTQTTIEQNETISIQTETDSQQTETDTQTSSHPAEEVNKQENSKEDEVEMETNQKQDQEKSVPPPPSRQTKVPRTFSSIIRTRRTKAEEKNEEETSSKSVGGAKTDTSDTESDDKNKTKPGRGQGRSSSVRRTLKGPEPKVEGVVEGVEFKGPPPPPTTSKESPSTGGYRMTRATAAAAGLKTGDFLELPWQQKKRKRVGGAEEQDESSEHVIKKMKEENEEEELPSEYESEDGETTPITTTTTNQPEKITRPSPRGGRGRGRGKRGGGASRSNLGGNDKTDQSNGLKDEEKDEISNKKKKMAEENTVNDDTSVKDSTKKKRGRPKRKGKEATPTHSDTPTSIQSPPIKIEEEEKHEINNNNNNDQNGEAPRTVADNNKGEESTEMDTTVPLSDNKESISDNNNNEVNDKSEDKKEDKKEGEEEKVVVTTSGTTPTTSQAPPINVPVESGYPFPRYSLEDQGYTHSYPPHHLHHSFLPPSYPPFSAPPYHTFMIPTSPHFPPYPPPPPQDCMGPPPPPPQSLYFSDDPFNRYPPNTATNSTSANVQQQPPPTSTVQSNTDKVSSPSSEVAVTTPTNPSHPATPTISTPVTHNMPLPHPLTYTPSHIGPPTHHYPPPPLPPHFGPMIGNMLAEWNMGHQIPPQAPPSQPPAPPPPPPPTAPTKAKEPRFPITFLPQEDNHHSAPFRSVSNPVNCPECGRHFKNNKALNGHMRLHGGFDWTKRICRPYVMGATKKDEDTSNTSNTTNATAAKTNNDKSSNKNNDIGEEGGSGRGSNKKDNKSHHKNNEIQTNKSNKEKEARPSATLDDLCRAAEELERIERDSIKPRPSPLILPHERRITSFSPPYTPPPILSPARSLVLLSGSAASAGPIPTPNKIWPQRKGSDTKGIRELEEPFEPKINIGNDFQAKIPDYMVKNGGQPSEENKEEDKEMSIDSKDSTDERSNSKSEEKKKETLVWEPLSGLTQEDEDTVDGYLELACSPAVPFGGRNKELALHLLKQVNGSVKEAIRLLVMGKSLMNPGHDMTDYNYTGTKRWSAKERQQFRRAWRVHRKQFNMLQSSVETKSLPDIVEYYYFWKKYCPDEYRGRNRHISDEVLSEDEDEVLLCPSSTGSNSTAESNDADQQPLDDSAHLNGTLSSASKSSIISSSGKSQNGDKPPKVGGSTGGRTKNSRSNNNTTMTSHDVARDISRGFNNPSLNYGPLPTQQEHRCKYPGCNQVYSSIFALNGHIRIHGGSWYPKKFDVENSSEASSSVGGSTNSPLKDTKREEELRKHQLEIAKTMVTELSQPRSPACSLGTLTPSPKPSPGRGKSSLVKSKKACSSSPADREGFYPCNRCGRVFQKVKSRSAHMKSHIIKQVH